VIDNFRGDVRSTWDEPANVTSIFFDNIDKIRGAHLNAPKWYVNDIFGVFKCKKNTHYILLNAFSASGARRIQFTKTRHLKPTVRPNIPGDSLAASEAMCPRSPWLGPLCRQVSATL
jgi:hypothetical protein